MKKLKNSELNRIDVKSFKFSSKRFNSLDSLGDKVISFSVLNCNVLSFELKVKSEKVYSILDSFFEVSINFLLKIDLIF